MTKEEAIKVLEKVKRVAEIYESEDVKAYNMAIELLKQEPCEDCISRQAVLDATVKKNSIWNSITNSKGENLEEIISQLPPATSQPKIGHWLKDSNGTLCSICRGYAIDDEGLDILTDYCPWCGAKMVKPQESEDKRCI